MKLYLNLLFLLVAFQTFAQETKLPSQDIKFPAPMIAVDSLYREDQFYAGFTYNILRDRPSGVTQNKFSSGFTLGFLRDFPINKERTVAIAPGIGLSFNKYFHSLIIYEVNTIPVYTSIPVGQDYTKDKLEQLFIDVPIEFRWRTSTPETHKFWRIYTGIKFSYLIYDKYIYKDNFGTTKLFNNPGLNNLQVGTYVAMGRNTLNFYVYYGWLPLFNSSAKINNEKVGMNTLNLGLMFYIL